LKVPAGGGCAGHQGERSGRNYAFVDAISRKNVELTMVGIRSGSVVIAQVESTDAVKSRGRCPT
jgi:carbonic anhydrase